MVYIMNEGMPIGKPSLEYYECIKQGYMDNEIPINILESF